MTPLMADGQTNQQAHRLDMQDVQWRMWQKVYNVCKKQYKGFNKRKVNKELGNQLISNATSSAISFKMDNGIWKLSSSNKKKQVQYE